MVLTVQTTEIAACTSDREALGAGVEVIQRFLLDGVDGQRTGLTIYLAHEHTILIATAPADTRLAVRYLAMMRTEQTLHPSIIQPLIIPALHLQKSV